MSNMNIIKCMDEIKNILSYSKKTGFFFGAGTSCAFGLPNITKLTEDVLASLDANEKEIIDTIIQKEADVTGKEIEDITIESILNVIRQIRSITNDSDKYSFMDIDGEFAKKLDMKICSNIYSIINVSESSVALSELERFIAWFVSLNCNSVKEIYTTNYDLLLEKTMEKMRIPYLDGFSGSYEPFFDSQYIEYMGAESDFTLNWLRLWKIHGSLNWRMKNVDDNNVARIVRTGYISPEHDELMIYPSREKYSLSRREPFIAYFDRLKKYLLNGELLFIVSGYSFSDQHINEIFFNALRHNNRLYILVLCYEDKNVDYLKDYVSSFYNICVIGPNKIIHSGVLYNLYFDSTYKEDCDSDFYWQDGKGFLLGDFKKLVEFLVEMSGKKSKIEDIVHGK